jgi:hypothetical protein
MLNSAIQLPNCLKRAETSVILIVFDVVLYEVCVKELLPFLTIAQHEPGTRKAISWSVTVYSKHLSSQ